MLSYLTALQQKFLQSPKIVKIVVALVCVYAIYWVYAHPLFLLVLKGLWAILPFVLKMLWAMVKYFAVLLVLQVIFSKTIKNEWYTKIAWLSVLVIMSLLDSLGLFGDFSWNPLKIKSSIDYFWVQMQLLSFYYIIWLLILPKPLWNIMNQLFIITLTLLSSGISLIPVVGSFLGSVLSAVVTFAVITFFILNNVALGLVSLDKYLKKN